MTRRAAHALAIALAACSAWPARVHAAPAAKLKVALLPEVLGQSTTIQFGFTVYAPPGQVPTPITGLELYYPAHFGIITSGLGIANCTTTTIENDGLEGCPIESLMGYGNATGEVEIEHEILTETAQTLAFMAPITASGNIALSLYVEGESPIQSQLVFPALLLDAAPPYGGNIAISIPQIHVLPGTPAVSLVRFESTIGPRHILYYKRARPRYRAYKPRGIILPAQCPNGGFPFAARFTFIDSTTMTAHARVPCPKSTHARTSSR